MGVEHDDACDMSQVILGKIEFELSLNYACILQRLGMKFSEIPKLFWTMLFWTVSC